MMALTWEVKHRSILGQSCGLNIFFAFASGHDYIFPVVGYF